MPSGNDLDFTVFSRYLSSIHITVCDYGLVRMSVDAFLGFLRAIFVEFGTQIALLTFCVAVAKLE